MSLLTLSFILTKEVELYKRHLLDKPAVLALNKIDCDPDGALVKDIIARVKSLPGSIFFQHALTTSQKLFSQFLPILFCKG